MPHLLAAGKLHPSGEALLRDLETRGFTVDYIEEVSEPSYAPLIAKADALVIRTQPLSAATIAQAEAEPAINAKIAVAAPRIRNS